MNEPVREGRESGERDILRVEEEESVEGREGYEGEGVEGLEGGREEGPGVGGDKI